MKKLNLRDIIQVIDEELKWCLKHPDKAFHKEYRKGFMNGLIQAKYLIGSLEEILED